MAMIALKCPTIEVAVLDINEGALAVGGGSLRGCVSSCVLGRRCADAPCPVRACAHRAHCRLEQRHTAHL
jgi:hypothetical protein